MEVVEVNIPEWKAKFDPKPNDYGHRWWKVWHHGEVIGCVREDYACNEQEAINRIRYGSKVAR